MAARKLLPVLLLGALAGSAHSAEKVPAGKLMVDSSDSMCNKRVDDPVLWESIRNLGTCLRYCPTPGGADACITGRTGLAFSARETGGAFDDRLACTVHLMTSARELQAAVASTDGGHWHQGAVRGCPNEFGVAAEVAFRKARTDESFYLGALTIMQKGSVRGARFAPLLYQALGARESRIKALTLSLLRRNFINTSNPADRVMPPDEVLIPLMYDADPTVAAGAVTAMADKIFLTKAAGAPRVDESLALLGPVAGTNDTFNPLPAGVHPPAPAARKAALDEIDRLMGGADKPSRHKILRHLMRLPCEDGAIHKAAFDLYYKILASDTQFLRTEKQQKAEDGTKISREDLWADQLYKALYGAGDMGGSKNERASGPKYARNCIGPMRAN